MFNAKKPSLEELPSSAQLIRSTLLAALAAIVILVTVVLPAEYAIDPTGIGRLIGLAEMGEIKKELAEEVERDRQTHGFQDQSSLLDQLLGLIVPAAEAQIAWRDQVSFTLKPGASAEVKLVMTKGASATYSWQASGGRINFDLHAHGGGEAVTYEKGRGKTEGDGSFTAPFTGDHGWFWRNRDKKDVTVILYISGDYSKLAQKN